jgi:hypothetical protein
MMGLSCRMFLLDQNDSLYRLANTKFAQMLQDPKSHCFLFAGHRVRMADAIVELIDRKPIRVARLTFGILTFDKEGRFDPRAFEQQQFARAELAMVPLIAAVERNAKIVDAASRFVAQGGRWTPSKTLARAIEDAALGRIKCPRL